MPRISQFFGIVIYMYYNDHQPPHFHAEYGEHEVIFEIDTLAVMRGGLPRRAQAMVVEWALQHRAELRQDWLLARQQQTLSPIEPLD